MALEGCRAWKWQTPTKQGVFFPVSSADAWFLGQAPGPAWGPDPISRARYLLFYVQRPVVGVERLRVGGGNLDRAVAVHILQDGLVREEEIILVPIEDLGKLDGFLGIIYLDETGTVQGSLRQSFQLGFDIVGGEGVSGNGWAAFGSAHEGKVNARILEGGAYLDIFDVAEGEGRSGHRKFHRVKKARHIQRLGNGVVGHDIVDHHDIVGI